MMFLVHLAIRPNALNCEPANQCNHDSDNNSEQVAVRQTQIQANMFESFQYRNECNGDCSEKYLNGYVALCVSQRVVLTKNQALHALIDQERDKTRHHR